MRQNPKAASSLFLSPATESPGGKTLLTRILAGQTEIETLSNEKINLAQRLAELLTRTRARLDADLIRVRILQGESPSDIRASSSLHTPTQSHSSISPYSTRRMDSNPILQLEQSLRSAIVAGSPAADSGILALTPPSSTTYNKSESFFLPFLQVRACGG